ncbi:MAG: accessory factor UbiK family protein [Pseudomonadota bacterium]|nr:accessory factor UbiK family protein [Pseudomonadota bacterium]HJO36338.1 accessory factor UbiK family protein [Gammaproteobacteria bacterium]
MDVIEEGTNGSSRDDLIRRLTDRLADAVPSGARVLREDLQRNFGAVLSRALERMELVSREEFEVQCEVLRRARAELAALEARVATLEAERDAGGA